MIYISIALFFLGFILGILFNKYINIDIKIKKNKPINKEVKTSNNKVIDDIRQLLEEIKYNNNLPIKLSPVVLRSLVEISKTPNWENKLDSETIKNLHKIYEKWQRHINSKNNVKVNKLGSGDGFSEYWEGTIEEYNEALATGNINDKTKVKLYEYTGEQYKLNDNGTWEDDI